MKEITIGRDHECDICLGSQCERASRFHAKIYHDGNNLIFKDESTNGTTINGHFVNGRAVAISYGDEILIAEQYRLSWSRITDYFPVSTHNAVTQRKIVYPQNYDEIVNPRHEEREEKSEPSTLHDWNWGAFLLYPIWGFGNGCWWAILVAMVFGATIIPNFIFGVYGNRWAWKNRSWSSADDFENTQKSWTKWTLVYFGAIFVLVFSLFFVISILAL